MNTIVRLAMMVMFLAALQGCSTVSARIQGAINSMPWTQKEVDVCPPSFGVTHCHQWKRMRRLSERNRRIVSEGRQACKMPKERYPLFEATRTNGNWICPKRRKR
jgi:hypothetical protein